MLLLLSQECLDESTMGGIIMRAQFTQKALIVGTLIAHIVSNLLVFVLFFGLTYPFFGGDAIEGKQQQKSSILFRSGREVLLVMVLVLYYIISYDILFHAMPALSEYVEMKQT